MAVPSEWMAAFTDAAEIRIGYLREIESKARLSLIEVPAEDDGLAGARLAINDNNTTGKFLNQQFSLEYARVLQGDDLAATTIALAEPGVALVIADNRRVAVAEQYLPLVARIERPVGKAQPVGILELRDLSHAAREAEQELRPGVGRNAVEVHRGAAIERGPARDTAGEDVFLTPARYRGAERRPARDHVFRAAAGDPRPARRTVHHVDPAALARANVSKAPEGLADVDRRKRLGRALRTLRLTAPESDGRLGMFQSKRCRSTGDAAAAAADYEEGLAITRNLVKQNPGNTQWQRDVFFSLTKIGDLKAQAGDTTAAAGPYSEAVAIARHLADLDPGNPSLLLDVAQGFCKIGDVKLAAHPESFQLDPASGRIFVNVPDAGQIAVVDLATARQVASWTVPGLRANFPLAIDDSGTTIATVFRHPPKLVLLDSKTGAATQQLDTCGDADDVFFDAKRRRIYVSCGAHSGPSPDPGGEVSEA